MVDGTIMKLNKCVDEKQSFTFTAGAGSGKTYSLIKVLEHTNYKYSKILQIKNQKIACITYTNAGVDEINERLPKGTETTICTIHQFLWSLVKNYQKELKKELKNYFIENVEIYNEKVSRARKVETKNRYQHQSDKFQYLLDNIDTNENKVTYQDKSNYKKNVISHDVLLKLSLKVLKGKKNYIKLISNIYPFIYIDEYQDTFKEIAELFAEISKYATIGFFGDPMQKIYDRGVGNLNEICNGYYFKPIYSEKNRRSSSNIVKLINKIRTDGLVQEPVIKEEGTIKFYHVKKPIDTVELLEELNIKDFTEFQILHKRIAERNNYLNLFEMVKTLSDIDVLINNAENRNVSILIDMIFDIENYLVDPFINKQKLILKKNLKKFNCLSLNMQEFIDMKNTMTFTEYCTYLYENGLYLVEEDTYKQIVKEELFVVNEYMKKENKENKLLLEEFTNYISSLENQKIVTSHSTKGKEYNDVVAIINEDDWNRKYRWSSYWQNLDMTESQYINTSNLFYVICSRAINNLIIIFIDENEKLKNFEKLEKMFGIENVKSIK